MPDEPRKRGRPPGSRNKPRDEEGRLTPPSSVPLADYKLADPETLVSRQLSMVDWAQQAVRNEMQRAYQSKGTHIQTVDLDRLETLSNTLVRTMDALKKCSDVAEELSKRMSAEQLLEAAAKKIEGQDAATLRYFIKRFRAYLERVSPTTPNEKRQAGDAYCGNASSAVNALDDE